MAADPVARLVVVRHAKTHKEAATDRARTLTERGERDAQAAGEWLAASGLPPEVLLASPAARARRTAELVAAALSTPTDVVLIEELYEASAADALHICAEGVDADVRCAAVVGHNPATEELTRLLQAGAADPVRLRPGALAVFEIDPPWAELRPGQARLVDLFSPSRPPAGE